MTSILIVEDEPAIANLIYTSLHEEGYACTCAMDGAQAADLIERNHYDLILLDVMLPEIDGYELLSFIQSMTDTNCPADTTRPQTPVIFITAKSTTGDKIKGLKLGADDYLSKPFQIGELLARVEAVLRRYGKNDSHLAFGDVTIQLDSRQVSKQGVPINLTQKEFDLLVELIRNKNIALYRDRLYEKVWQEPFMGETRTLDSHIQRLRKKLAWEDQIKTVFRIGYRLEG